MPEYVNYNPDVLSCLANLSNDEVFTPPEIANAMLDMLPQELFEDPNAKFLDPACKTGVFLREIAKRLLKGLEKKMPNLQERINHIFHEQLYAIAITELTALMSRRSVYCTKAADSIYSVTPFENKDGNIRFQRTEHTWDSKGKDAKCIYCGASREQFDRGSELETHAYEFIHVKDIYKMKFDLIISNPPYQLETNSETKQAKPIYHIFVEQAKKLRPRYMSFIIPSRWFAGGMGLDSFREEMTNDGHVTHIVDYANAKNCFPQNSISGGVCYFLWERDKSHDCEFTNVISNERNTMVRSLSQYPVLVRYNKAISILKKITDESLSSMASSISPFGIATSVRGLEREDALHSIGLYSSAGLSYIEKSDSMMKNKFFDKWKILLSQTSAEHAGEPSKDGKFRVLTSSMKVIPPKTVCSHSYILIGPLGNKEEATNVLSYLQTKFVRFLILMALSSIHISRQTLIFVPIQNFSKAWSDSELYKKYGLTEDEISFIESMIKPFNGED